MKKIFVFLLFALCVLPLFVAVPSCKDPEPMLGIDKELASFFDVYTTKDSTILYKQVDAEKYDTLIIIRPYAFSGYDNINEYSSRVDVKFAHPDSGKLIVVFILRCCDKYCSGTQMYGCYNMLADCEGNNGCVITNSNYEDFDNLNKQCQGCGLYNLYRAKSVLHQQEKSLLFIDVNSSPINVNFSGPSNRSKFELIMQKNKGLVAYSFIDNNTGERRYYEKL